MEGTSFRWRWRRWLLGCSVLAAAPGDSISAGAVRGVQAGPRRARQSSLGNLRFRLLKGEHHVRTVVNNIRHNHWTRGLNLLLLIALAALPALGQAGETISLYDGMREGKVAAHFTATGSSSGDAIDLTINKTRSEEHTSELQSPMYLVCRLLLE